MMWPTNPAHAGYLISLQVLAAMKIKGAMQ